MHREVIKETFAESVQSSVVFASLHVIIKSSMWTVIWTTSDNNEDVVTADGGLPHDLLISYLTTCRNVYIRHGSISHLSGSVQSTENKRIKNKGQNILVVFRLSFHKKSIMMMHK